MGGCSAAWARRYEGAFDGDPAVTEELLIPFAYEYMRNAIYVSTVIGAVCGLLSCFVALKGWSLLCLLYTSPSPRD